MEQVDKDRLSDDDDDDDSWTEVLTCYRLVYLQLEFNFDISNKFAQLEFNSHALIIK